ncbi:hypothetical protein EJ06DRAFT_354889 [Trichodelitschia bisporula]|uniref:Uncharacterized protein n=1 Tax=Trichodelitschia bisporula TaxID=703511 RepID=A0A6G1I044_9PEZI|nr:hypothetical protein EJ06DRAFT_354889 [Trichodelitschia bisporula]
MHRMLLPPLLRVPFCLCPPRHPQVRMLLSRISIFSPYINIVRGIHLKHLADYQPLPSSSFSRIERSVHLFTSHSRHHEVYCSSTISCIDMKVMKRWDSLFVPSTCTTCDRPHLPRTKTYSNWDSLLVTHATTSQSVRGFTSVSRRGLVLSATYGRMC